MVGPISMETTMAIIVDGIDRTVEVQRTALNFAQKLGESMRYWEWEQFLYENQLWLSQGLASCPSHNHLDANAVMLEVWPDAHLDENTEMVNVIWDLTRRLLRDLYTRTVVGPTL
jgi:hypothetical protein